MKNTMTGLLKTSAVAIALMSSAALVGAVAFPDSAYAKGGNGKGGGNGGGNSGGNGGGNGGGHGGGHGGGNSGGNGGGNGNGHGSGNDGAGNSSGKGLGKGASKNAGKSATGKTSNKATGISGSRPQSSKGKKFSLKEIFGGRKSKANKPKSKATKTARTITSSPTVTSSVRPEKRPTGHKMASLLGAHPSELGALNAANASETALLNAAPNSRVGRIATYRETVLAGDDLRAALEEQQDLLDGMTPPDRSVSEIEQDLEAAQTDVQEKQDRVTELEEALEDAGGTDPDIEAALEEANNDLQDAIDTAESLETEKQDAVEYEEAVAEVEDLTEAVEDQGLTEREALENAANKPVTDEVEAAVKSLLGLDG